MIDEAAFLRTIRDHPDDDSPRLVFADWLEEHGETWRAEFLRAQCKLARAKPRERGRGALARRVNEILKVHRDDMLGQHLIPIRLLTGGAIEAQANDQVRRYGFHGTQVEFRRGFVAALESELNAFLRIGPELLRRAVLEYLGVFGEYRRYSPLPSGSRLVRLLASELPGVRPRALTLRSCHLSLSALRSLCRNPGWSRLERFWLMECNIDDAAAATIARSPRLGSVVELSLQSNPLGDAGLRAISESPHLKSLTTLRIGDNWRYEGYSLAGLIELAESPHLPRLAKIEVDRRIAESQVDFFHRRYGMRVQLEREEGSDMPF
jgi:uncharacterized protein (TIGR02996 family)